MLPACSPEFATRGLRALAPLPAGAGPPDAARFAQLSHFLSRPEWEATSNGAERMARRFRQGQAPHYRLRTPAAVEGALAIWACQHKLAMTGPATGGRLAQAGRSARGRQRHADKEAGALAA